MVYDLDIDPDCDIDISRILDFILKDYEKIDPSLVIELLKKCNCDHDKLNDVINHTVFARRIFDFHFIRRIEDMYSDSDVLIEEFNRFVLIPLLDSLNEVRKSINFYTTRIIEKSDYLSSFMVYQLARCTLIDGRHRRIYKEIIRNRTCIGNSIRHPFNRQNRQCNEVEQYIDRTHNLDEIVSFIEKLDERDFRCITISCLGLYHSSIFDVDVYKRMDDSRKYQMMIGARDFLDTDFLEQIALDREIDMEERIEALREIIKVESKYHEGYCWYRYSEDLHEQFQNSSCYSEMMINLNLIGFQDYHDLIRMALCSNPPMLVEMYNTDLETIVKYFNISDVLGYIIEKGEKLKND